MTDLLTPDTRPELIEKIKAEYVRFNHELIPIIARVNTTGEFAEIEAAEDEFFSQILALCEKEIEKQAYDKGFDDGCVFNVYEAKTQERERIISQIEQMDKRHTVSFVLQVLRGEVKEVKDGLEKSEIYLP